MARSVSHATAPVLSVMVVWCVREAKAVVEVPTNCLVSAVAGSVNDVHGWGEREDAFFECAGRLVVPVVECCGMRDRVQFFGF